MAKVVGPLHSDEAHGSYGDTMTFRYWRGVTVCGKKVTSIGGEPSVAQQVQRGYWKTAVTAWDAEISATKTLWNNYATNASLRMSGFNLYVGAYVDFLVGSTGVPPTVTNVPPNIS